MCIYKSHERGYPCMPMVCVQPTEKIKRFAFLHRKERATSQNKHNPSHSLQANTCGKRGLSQYLCANGFICFQVS